MIRNPPSIVMIIFHFTFPSLGRDLVRRDKNFFMTAPILQIEMWNIRVDTAIEQGKK